jgi:hypothetical protein
MRGLDAMFHLAFVAEIPKKNHQKAYAGIDPVSFRLRHRAHDTDLVQRAKPDTE